MTPASRRLAHRDLQRARKPDLRRLRTAYGLGQEQFSLLTGFSVRSLAAWEAGRAPGVAARRRLQELERLRAALATVVRREAVSAWLDAPNPAFGGLKPLEVIERGEIDRLWRMVHELGGGVPA